MQRSSLLRGLRAPGVLGALTGLRALALLALGAVPAMGQSTGTGTAAGGGTYQGPITQHPLVVPATPFQWATTSGLGPVKVPFPGQFGWTHIVGLDFQIRVVPSLSTDPTLEAILYPPASGHPTKAERITIQFPTDPDAIRGGGAMVLAFHSFGVSEKDIWVNTDLPQLCAQKGWLLVAPYGLVDTHYGNIPSQKSLDKVLELVDAFFDWDQDRTYAVGFSMGGGAAMSYAMRHMDGKRTPIAGVINHTGTIDLLHTYQTGTPALKAMMANQHHFGAAPGSPETNFAYERVSPATLIGGAIEPFRTRARNLSHLPLYFFSNLDDPQVDLVQHNAALGAYLAGEGVNVNQVQLHAGSQHAWSTLNLETAFDWLEHYKLPATPLDAAVSADNASRYHHTYVRAKPWNRIAYYEVSADIVSSTVSVTDTRDLGSLVLHLDEMGFAPRQFVGGLWSSQDGSDDRLVLTGYQGAPPSQVLFGGQPTTDWTHDPLLGEVTLYLSGGAGTVIWSVTP